MAETASPKIHRSYFIKRAGLSKIYIPVFFTFAIFVFTVFTYIIPYFKEVLMEQKRIFIMQMTESAWSMLQYFESLERKGKFSREEAQKEAKEYISQMRYGNEMKDYFWINDYHPRMIMHPYRPDLDNSDLTGFKDPHGKHLFVEVVKIVKDQGAGYIDYMWQWKDNPKRIVPKISYVKRFKPWGWIIGTGIYIEDVNYEIEIISKKITISCLLILTIIMILLSYITYQAIKYENIRKVNEKKITENEKHYRTLFESVNDAIVLLKKGIIIECNPKSLELFRCEKSELLSKDMLFFSPVLQQDGNNSEKELKDKINDASSGKCLFFEWNSRRIDKSEFDAEITFSKVELSDDSYILAVIRDITERKQAEKELRSHRERLEELVNERTEKLEKNNIKLVEEINERKHAEEALRKSEARFKIIFENSGTGIVFTDKDGSILFTNKAFQNLIGYHEEELVNINITSLSYASNTFSEMKHINELYKNKRSQIRFEKQLSTKNHEYKWVDLSIATILDNSGDLSNLVFVVSDIDIRKETEKMLQEAKDKAERASRAKGEFLANMSHEIRTPMSAIIGYSELLKPRIQDEKSKEFLNGILTGGSNLLGLIDDILDLSKIEAGMLDISLEAVNLRELCGDLAQIFKVKIAEKNLHFFFEICSDLPDWLMLDEIRIRQILLNLIGNAVKFTEKGSISLKVKKENHNISMMDIIFEVRDTGIGIPDSQKEIIFGAFQQQEGQSTRRFGGTGLGLTITKRLTEMMGGRISIESEPGKGSTFRIHLKDVNIAATKPDQIEDHEKYESIVFNNAIILVVEDIESNLKVVKGLLEPHNVTIFTAMNGKEAIDIVMQTPPDLILMDMQMPVMDGYVATRILKSNNIYKSIPIIALTASSIDNDIRAIKELCDGYLRKPVSKSRLLRELSFFLPHTFPKGENDLQEVHDEDASFLQESAIPKELMEILCNEYLERWKMLNDNMLIEEIVNFAEDLQELSRIHNVDAIRKYAVTLRSLASSFKINSMIQTMERFTHFLR